MHSYSNYRWGIYWRWNEWRLFLSRTEWGWGQCSSVHPWILCCLRVHSTSRFWLFFILDDILRTCQKLDRLLALFDLLFDVLQVLAWVTFWFETVSLVLLLIMACGIPQYFALNFAFLNDILLHVLADRFRVDLLLLLDALASVNISQHLTKLEAVDWFFTFTVWLEYVNDLFHGDDTSEFPVLYEFDKSFEFQC